MNSEPRSTRQEGAATALVAGLLLFSALLSPTPSAATRFDSGSVRGIASSVDGDGTLSASEAEADYAFVAHAQAGLLVYDLTNRTTPLLVAQVRLPIAAAGVDPELPSPVLSEVDPVVTGDVPVTVTTTRTFDARGARVSETDQLGNFREWVVDARGNTHLAIDPERQFTETVYDGLGRVTRTVRPEGITVESEYDGNSNLTVYRDALGGATSYEYDALDRRTKTSYADGTEWSIDYDLSSNPTGWRDAMGTQVAQTFDDAGRLLARTALPGEGVVGPATESFQYDSLNRLVRAQSGDVVATRTYDSLSRLREETVDGKRVQLGLDATGNPIRMTYPSGLVVDQLFDANDRLQRVQSSSALLVEYGFRGPDLVSNKRLGNGLEGSWSFDGAKRPVSSTFAKPTGETVFGESMAWSPRGRLVASSRTDKGGVGKVAAYDRAGRLTGTAETPDASEVANNTVPALPTVERGERFTYDQAENLVQRVRTSSGIPEEIALPVDDSGRNRPGSVGSTELSWTANGNLASKSLRQFSYDFRNRLMKVDDGASDLASYRYDAFNRRVSSTANGVTESTAWAGWQALETYRNGQLHLRKAYGLGLDEIVRQELDQNGDGTPELVSWPVYDQKGDLVAMTGTNGKPVERYRISSYGADVEIRADLTPPAVQQVRVKDSALWLEASEGISLEEIRKAAAAGQLSLISTATGDPIGLVVTQPVRSGPNAERRQVLTLASAPTPGDELKLRIEPAALADEFFNRPEDPVEWTFLWPGTDAVISDTATPEVQRLALRSGRLELVLSEEPNLEALAGTVLLDSVPIEWTLGEDRTTLTSVEAVGAGAHAVAISTAALDLSGKGIADAFGKSFTKTGVDALLHLARIMHEAV